MDKNTLLGIGTSDLLPVDLGNGRTVHVRALSITEVEVAQDLIKKGKAPIATWTMLSACDETGTRLFSDNDYDEVAKLPVKVGKAICEGALKQNGLSTDEADDAKKKLADDPTEQFLYELCLSGVGGPYSASPRHLKQVLTASDLRGWLAFHDICPIGSYRDDLRAGLIAFMIGCTVPRKSGHKPPGWDKFIIAEMWNVAEQKPEDHPAVFRQLAAAFKNNPKKSAPKAPAKKAVVGPPQ